MKKIYQSPSVLEYILETANLLVDSPNPGVNPEIPADPEDPVLTKRNVPDVWDDDWSR